MKCIIGNKKWVYGFRDELKISQNIIRSGILFLLSILFINNASAGGFGLGVTRLIYPAESKQITLSVQNSGDNTSYLIQSWVDDSKTEKKS
ncbi:fimbria/pilus periplasmic chaperone [Escherichia coli]|nr:fimbria/pilus periplasmic chaperone [Escherichia coli]